MYFCLLTGTAARSRVHELSMPSLIYIGVCVFSRAFANLPRGPKEDSDWTGDPLNGTFPFYWELNHQRLEMPVYLEGTATRATLSRRTEEVRRAIKVPPKIQFVPESLVYSDLTGGKYVLTCDGTIKSIVAFRQANKGRFFFETNRFLVLPVF